MDPSRRWPALAALVLAVCAGASRPDPVPAPVALHAPADGPRDTDRDGLTDVRDACPREAGARADGCPARDADGDGVLDAGDRCPFTPGIERDGCPIPDTDGDGHLDPGDACPAAPETRNGYLDADGCPEELPAALVQLMGPIRGVQFELDSDSLKPTSRPVLDRAARVLAEYPEIRIEISGHSTSAGSVEHNVELTRRRAETVKAYLVARGIDAGRLETRGVGPHEPFGCCYTCPGYLEKQRRIEFTILVPCVGDRCPADFR